MAITLKYLTKLIKRVNEGTWYISVVLLLLMTLAVLVQIFMRKVFSNPISWIEEFCSYAMFFSAFLMAPYLVFRKLNINMTLFYDKIHSLRIQGCLNAFLHLLRIIGLVTLFPHVYNAVVNNWLTTTTQMPFSRGQIYTVVLYSFSMMILVVILQMIEDGLQIYYNKKEFWAEL